MPHAGRIALRIERYQHGQFPWVKQELWVLLRIKIFSGGFGGFSCRLLPETGVGFHL